MNRSEHIICMDDSLNALIAVNVYKYQILYMDFVHILHSHIDNRDQ